MVALAEKTDSQPRIIEGAKATSVSLGGETFSFTPEGKTMAMRGFDMVSPQDISPTLREVTQKIMQERGIDVAERTAPANDFTKLELPKGLTTFAVDTNPTFGSQPILATNITLPSDTLGRA